MSGAPDPKADLFYPLNIPSHFPDDVNIIGAGPPNDYDTPQRMTIVCGRAINRVSQYEADIWIIADRRNCELPYFKPADEAFTGRRVFAYSAAASSRWWDADKGDLWFKLVPEYDESGVFHPPTDRMRPDETTAGIAVWLAYMCGARRINLYGVAMSGDTYWDGEPGNYNPAIDDHAGGDRWKFTDSFNRLIWYVMSQGVEVVAMTETKLSIPVVE